MSEGIGTSYGSKLHPRGRASGIHKKIVLSIAQWRILVYKRRAPEFTEIITGRINIFPNDLSKSRVDLGPKIGTGFVKKIRLCR